MTDEEKSEGSYIKYRDEKCEITRNAFNNHLHKDWRKSGVDRHKAYTDGYLDGLAEGKKELTERNEELKNMASKQVDAILELYGQIEKMKFDIKVEAERNAYISQATLNHLLEQWEKAE